ncbi:MAG: hypothetical protein HFI86_05790 [Bacilli bacterium]|nr:hypothetical protein [Bacilli bacterium]
MKIFKLIIISLIAIMLCGCDSWQNAQEQNIENCKNQNGIPKITYCNGNSNNICEVSCILKNDDIVVVVDE